MGISHINWLAGLGFLAISLIVLVWRLIPRPRTGIEYQFGWALGGGFGAAAVIKAAYPLYLFIRYKSIDVHAIDDLWLYIYGGSVAGVFAGLAIIVWSFRITRAAG